MNELEFLRSQLRLERAHLDASRTLLSRALQPGAPDTAAALVAAARGAALAHLAFALPRALERGRIHIQLVSDRLARAGDSAAERNAAHAALVALQDALGSTETAIAALAAHGAAPSIAAPEHGPVEAAALAQRAAERIAASSDALEPWCTRLYDLSDWRRAGRIDAESVFEERRLHEAAANAARDAGLLD